MDIVNKLIIMGAFPDNWKESLITQIQKIAKARLCEEFRPINTLKTRERILEKVVKSQLEKYMESNALLHKYQSGFRKKFSCETAVNYKYQQMKKKKLRKIRKL